MGRAPCCDKANVKKGPWSPEEDEKLKEYIDKQGTGGNWIALPQKAGLKRCGKSCRLRWLNYLRPNIKHGDFSDEEDKIIYTLYANIGSRWSIIAAQLPGRTDNDIKNYWNTKLKKKLVNMMNIHPIINSQRKLSNNFTSLLQATSLPSSPSTALSSSSSPSSFKYHNTTITRPFSINGMPFSSQITNGTNSFSSTTTNLLQNQETYMGSSQNYYQMKESISSNNILGFGGHDQVAAAASCSSSDGSFGNNKVINLYNNNGVGNEYDQMIDQYGLEEIKQLISSNSRCNNFLYEENKTDNQDERVMMYY